MKRIVLPILLFAVLIWLVPLAGFLLGGAFRQCRAPPQAARRLLRHRPPRSQTAAAWACSKAFCLRTTQGKTPF